MPKPTKAQLDVLRTYADPSMSDVIHTGKPPHSVEVCRKNGWIEYVMVGPFAWGNVRLTDAGRAVLEQYGEV